MELFPWFKRIGPVFLPATIPGWLILAASIAYTVYLFVDIDRRSHSVSDTLINFAFNAFIVLVIYSLVGFVTSFRKSH